MEANNHHPAPSADIRIFAARPPRLEDSRRASVAFEAMLRAADGRVRVLSVAMDFGGDWLKPQTDELEVDDAAVLDWLSARTAARG